MDPRVRTEMESRLGRNLADVRIHSDAAAAESAQSVNARAYTIGRDIVFGAGRFSPSTAAGMHLLAHELTHVVQQGGAMDRVVHRTAEPGSAGAQVGGSQATQSLLNLIANIEQVQANARPAIDSATPSGAPHPAGPALGAVSSALSQIRTAAGGSDERLKAQILMAFAPARLARAERETSAVVGTPTIEGSSDRKLAAMPLEVSTPHDPAEVEAERVASEVMAHGYPDPSIRLGPHIVSRDAATALAGASAAMTTFELAGGVEVEAATGPPGWVVAGVIGLAILATAGAAYVLSRPKPCPPCPPNPAPRIDRVPPSAPHWPCPGDHWHYQVYNQNPQTCQCFLSGWLFGGCLPQGGVP
jgi:hypothetical protein